MIIKLTLRSVQLVNLSEVTMGNNVLPVLITKHLTWVLSLAARAIMIRNMSKRSISIKTFTSNLITQLVRTGSPRTETVSLLIAD